MSLCELLLLLLLLLTVTHKKILLPQTVEVLIAGS